MLITILMMAGIVVYIWLMCFRNVFKRKWYEILLITVLLMFLGVLNLKLLAVIEAFGDLNTAANMRLYGAVFFDPIGFYIIAKCWRIKPSQIFDIFAIGLVITLIFGRIDCLISGCCTGTKIPFLTSSHFKWPIREIEIVFYVAFIIIYCKKIWRGETKGEVYPIFMISYGVLRFFLEFFRQEATLWGSFHPAFLWSVLSCIIGLSFYLELHYEEKLKKSRRRKND